MKPDALFRTAAVLSMLVAGSCSVANDGATISEDGARNHPITVEPSYRELKVQFAGETEGMTPEDAIKFDAFVADYRAHGNGSLGISVPNGASANAAIAFFAERAATSGLSRDKILVSARDASNGDYRVDVSYIVYSAHADSCGDWSEDLAFTAENQTAHNFGCSVQHNIAAMIADPRDLVSPRPFETADGKRAATVIDNYEQGKTTAAEKTSDQSAAVSDVNKQ